MHTAIFIVLIPELVIADAVVFIAAETMQQICNTKDRVFLLNVSMGKLLSATLV